MNLYEFYCDGDKFFDPRIQELPTQNAQLDLALNDAGQLTFTIPRTHPKADIFKPLTSTIEIFRDGEWMWEGRIVDSRGSFNGSTTYTLEGCQSYLNDSVQPQYEYQGTPIGYVERILNVHNSQVPENRKIYLGAVTVQDPNNYMQCFTNFNPTLQELKEDIIDDLGGYIRFRKVDGKLYMDVLEEYDRTCTQRIEIGRNLIDLSPTFDYKEIASVIIPLGATLEDQEEHDEGLEALDKYVTIEEVNDGKNYIAREDLLEEYKQIWKVVHFDTIHTPKNLLNRAEEYLRDGQWGEMVIEAKAFDLNYTSEEFQEFRLGDKVRVTSEIHGLDRYFPITAQTICFDNVSANTITLGGTGTPISITGVTNQVTINTEKLDERIKDPNRLIQQAIYQATQLINQGLNGYVRVNGNEILIMDTDDPATAKHVWRWNMGGLGYSNNGYNGPFETAITMDGTIVGKFLAANSVAAEQIDVNYTSHVERLCNDYTDEKLGDYWTYSQTETYFRTLADSIEAGVNTTLEGYATKQYLSSQLSITESNITSTVTNNFNKTLDNYSTTREMNSAIEQSASSITSTVKSYVNDTLDGYSTTSQVQSMIKQSADSITTTLSKYVTDSEFSELEQKITADGIFTTINNGLAGSKKINTTKFALDRNGITIEGGGITIKNNSGTSVFYADTSGNLTLQGAVSTRLSDGTGWLIKDGYINYYRGSRMMLTIGSYARGGGKYYTMFSSESGDALVLSSSGMQFILDTNGIIFNNKSGNGHIYINRGGINYPGYTGIVDTGVNVVAQFYDGICTSVTGY